MKKVIFLLIACSSIAVSMNFNHVAVFSYPAFEKLTLVTSFGNVSGLGIGLKDKGFEGGLSWLNGGFAYAIFKSSRKFLIFSSESSWFISAGDYFENFSYSSISMPKTPVLARFAVRMAALPKCQEGDIKCKRERERMNDILNRIFDSSFLYRKISSLRMGYSMGILRVSGFPGIGFFNGDIGWLIGTGDTNGKNGWLVGVSWGKGIRLGAAVSAKFGIFQFDMGLAIGKDEISKILSVQVDLKGGKAFVLLSEDGIEFYVF